MKRTRDYFPLFVPLEGKRIYIAGAGKIAARRAGILLSFGAELSAAAPSCGPEMEELLRNDGGAHLTYQKKCFEERDLAGKDMVFAATGDAELNHKIAELCRGRGVPVNNASCKEDCDFFFPAIVQADGLTIGVSSGGTDHKKTAQICERLRRFFQNSF